MTYSVSELYAINFQNTEPKYYTIIPNILSDLTYDKIDEKTGEKKIMKLSVYARELYRVLRMTASGDCAKCWKTTETLAEECGMSTGSISNAKEELSQKFHQLDGNPLIHIKEIRTATIEDGKCINKKPKHEITIVNIWSWNNGYMSIKKHLKKEADSPHEPANPADSPHEPAQEGARSPHEINNNNSNNNPLFIKQQSTADAASAVSLINQNSVLSEEKVKAYEWLVKNGCPEKNAISIVKRFCCSDISNASKYTENQLQKNKKNGKKTDSIWAYFQNVLNQRYWEKGCGKQKSKNYC